jgi:RNA polymerase sigma-70 factor, ECF subfamily
VLRCRLPAFRVNDPLSGRLGRDHCLEPQPHNAEPTDADLLQVGYRYALSLTHHAEDAEDLVQEAWFNLCRRYSRVESRAILFKTIRNGFIDQCRRKKIVAFESLDQPEPPVLPAIDGEEPGVKGDLETLLAVLSPKQREALFLHYHQGHTAEEIAKLTQQPRGTVLSLLHRGVARLREAAEKEPGAFRCNQ